MRLQTVVSREISMMDRAVVTVGALQAGSSPNIIPDEALLRLNVRTFDEQVRETVLSAIKRIINAEATASQAPKPPAFTVVGEFPLTSNDEAATGTVTEALKGRFGSERAARQSRDRERGFQRLCPDLERAFGLLVRRRH